MKKLFSKYFLMLCATLAAIMFIVQKNYVAATWAGICVVQQLTLNSKDDTIQILHAMRKDQEALTDLLRKYPVRRS